MKGIAVDGIWLRYVGGENGPDARVVVEVQVNGEWVQVISEAHASAFSHCVFASGIRAAVEPDRVQRTVKARRQGALDGWDIRRAKEAKHEAQQG